MEAELRQQRTRASYDAVAEAYAHQVGPLAAADTDMAGVFDAFVARVRGVSSGTPVIVDAGCGPGWWSHQMAAAGAHVVGLDISPAMARIAKDDAGRVHGGARFVVGSAAALPLADGACDAVAFWYVLHHMADREVNCALREARRLCRSNGGLLIGGHVGQGERIKREGYGLRMEVLVAKRSPEWWETAVEEAGFLLSEHRVSEGSAHHVLWATVVCEGALG